jgi:phytoene dehydrogenase-like protein
MVAMYDAIVVGAGVGGLTAAARLARSGLRVVVLEKSDHFGGTASTYDCGGYTFPMGPLGFSSPGRVGDALNSLGLGDGLEFHRVDYKIAAFGMEAVVSLPYAGLIDELAGLFPSEEAGLRRFFKDVEEVTSELERAGALGRDPVLGSDTNVSAGEYLHKVVKDDRLRRVLGSIGTREPSSGFPILAAMWRLVSDVGIFYPEGGFSSFCSLLADEVMRRGEIRLCTGVSRITVKNGKVLGVVLADGTRLEAPGLVSNADFKTTFLKLLDEKDVPPEWRRAVSAARQSQSAFQVCLGLDESEVDLSSFDNASRIIYQGSGGDARSGPDDPAAQELTASLLSRDDSGLAPQGGAVMVIRASAEYDRFSEFLGKNGGRVAGYVDYKTRLANAVVEELSDLTPGLAGAVSVMDVATPLTFEECGGRYGGAVAGWSQEYRDSRDCVLRELVRTPLGGLYMAGHQAMSWLFTGGVPTAIESGVRAADELLDGTGPVSKVTIPGQSH